MTTKRAGITDLTPLQLSRMKKLRSLFLQRNDIAVTLGLANIPMLEDLVLDANRIKAISEGWCLLHSSAASSGALGGCGRCCSGGGSRCR